MNSVHTLTSYHLHIHFNIIPMFVWASQVVFSHQVFRLWCMRFSSPWMLHRPWLNHPNNISLSCPCAFLLIEHHAMKAYWGSGGIAPRILDLGTRSRWVFSFTPRKLYLQRNSPWYPFDRRLSGPQSRSESGGKQYFLITTYLCTVKQNIHWHPSTSY
jgi:hypothetical protein